MVWVYKMRIVEASTEDLCYMWSIGEGTKISLVDKVAQITFDLLCLFYVISDTLLKLNEECFEVLHSKRLIGKLCL